MGLKSTGPLTLRDLTFEEGGKGRGGGGRGRKGGGAENT